MRPIEPKLLCFLTRAGDWTGFVVTTKRYHKSISAPIMDGPLFIKEDCWEIESPWLTKLKPEPWIWLASPNQLIPIATFDPYRITWQSWKTLTGESE